MQRQISQKKNLRHLGETLQIMVEGEAKRQGQLMGRTDGNKIAVFAGSGINPGELVDVRVLEVTSNTLISKLV